MHMAEYFGEEIGTYARMYRFGLWTMLIGFMLWLGQYVFEKIYPSAVLAMDIYGIMIIFIGGMIALTGYLGYKDEKKKYGLKKVTTLTGNFSFFISLVSVFTMGHAGYISLIAGIAAIILGIISKKKGDNMYGEGSIYIGAIGTAGTAIIMALFYFFPT
ncbi:MAG: hypothetical protein GXO25_00380 [Euryarchaeota archaeon]|nr:hypothetical protein [Euryarchaeota archaeon]